MTNRPSFFPIAATFAVVAILAAVTFGSIAGCGAVKNWHRGQKLADARNKVRLTHIGIQTAQQQAQIVRANNARVQAEADQRVIAAIGIRKAQDHISRTLTPLYVQWEAIQAQLKLAGSPNSTFVYIPSGENGVPAVSTLPSPKR